jgi:hypothetical protein
MAVNRLHVSRKLKPMSTSRRTFSVAISVALPLLPLPYWQTRSLVGLSFPQPPSGAGGYLDGGIDETALRDPFE